ncbi:hypothetical protein [Streptomyces canus]|uniref:hypothetical protein n=1 Tax=Streptomyces canus TaxID=58343 RepID=UPI002F9133CE
MVFMVLVGCVLVMLVAGLVALAAAYLARRGGATYPAAALRAGAAFGATLAVTAAIAGALAALL